LSDVGRVAVKDFFKLLSFYIYNYIGYIHLFIRIASSSALIDNITNYVIIEYLIPIYIL